MPYTNGNRCLRASWTKSSRSLRQYRVLTRPRTRRPAIISNQPGRFGYHAGQIDLVLQKLSSSSSNCAPDKSTVMGYFDGNTVTALWNYAQHFAMSDSFFSTFSCSSSTL